MRIPSQFQIINRWYSVVDQTPSSHTKDDPCFGECDSNIGRIYLNGPEIPDRISLEQTFLHELIHACLDAIGKSKLSKDEDFVDALAAVLHQYMITNVGEFDDKHHADDIPF